MEKAEMIAEGDIEQLELADKKNAGYEISRLIESFNMMTSQIKNNLNEISSEKNKLENAKRMKDKGYPLEEIADITGLSIEEIEKL